MDPGNGFKLIFPKVSCDDDTKYNKFLKKASDIWQVTTGTMKASSLQSSANTAPRKKKRIKKKAQTNLNIGGVDNLTPLLDAGLANGGDEGAAEF